MRTQPRTDFEASPVITHDECCERCNSTNVFKDTFPPAGASWNPPRAMATVDEYRQKPRLYTCYDCFWQWMPDNPRQPGFYISRKEALANHDRGDEDRG
jgi:hypothetical protein